MTSHTPALDGLRGIAIILVLLHHFTILQPDSLVQTWWTRVALIGWSGVDLFFVLSGFLITGILIDARGGPRYFTSFYVRRTLRIFPLYYLVTFLSLVVLPWFPAAFDLLAGAGAPREQLPYWLYLTNFAVAARERFMHGVLDIGWSLAIEEQFYLLWPAVVWLCPPRLLGPLCLAIVMTVPLARTSAVQAGVPNIPIYVLPFFRADALAIGALLAWWSRRSAIGALTPLARVTTILGITGVVLVCWWDGDSWWWGRAMQTAGYSLLAVSGASLLVLATGDPKVDWWPRALSAPWLRSFGKYSYALYLFHLPVMRVVREYILPPDQFSFLGTPLAGQFIFYAVATIPSFALAWLSWRCMEAPILRLKARFPY